VQPATGALLHVFLVELPAQLGHLWATTGVGVGVAGSGSMTVAVHTDQRRRERVQCHARDSPLQRRSSQLGDDLAELVDHLIGIDLTRTVAAGPKGV
jgi:hypothetical protein